MKIKVLDEMNKIKLTVTHRELVLIHNALQTAEVHKDINNKMFDKDEANPIKHFIKVQKMNLKITETLKDINVW